MKKVIAILFLVIASCVPGVKTRLGKYTGDQQATVPYVKVTKYSSYGGSATSYSNSVTTVMELTVHNPTYTAFNVRVRCEYHIGDYHASTINSKRFLLRPRSSVVIDPFVNIVTIVFSDGSPIRISCKLRYGNKEDNESFSQ